MAKILDLGEFTVAQNTIYDPTCGSGSLLLRALSETNGKPRLRGQESDKITTTLAKLNMLLHNQHTAVIENGDTLNNPQFTDRNTGMLATFDVCVANPPFSQKNWLSATSTIGGEDDQYKRWNTELLPPAKCGDYAFLLHLIKSMKPDTGRGACILPHGVLFRGNAEYDIRKNLVDRHIIKGIIGLPANIFFGTGIPASIIVIDKKDTALRNGIFFIDAKEGYMKDGAKNRLREQDIRLIADTWKAQKDVPHYARFVTWKEILDNDYNLNIPRYIQPVDTEIVQDIEQHLKGKLPQFDIDQQMQHYWDIFPNLKKSLFGNKDGNAYTLQIPADEIRTHIADAHEVIDERRSLITMFEQWINDSFVPTVESYAQDGFNPKEIIELLGDKILDYFKNAQLTNNYDVYEILRNYWTDVLQDDSYIIRSQGWKITPTPILKKNKKDGTDIIAGYSYDPLTGELVARVYFADIQQELSDAEQKLSEADEEFNSYVDENSLGYFDDARYSRFTVIKTRKKKKVEEPGTCCKDCINRRLLEIVPRLPKMTAEQYNKAIVMLPGNLREEWDELNRYLDLYDQKTAATAHKNKVAKKLKDAILNKQKSFYDNKDNPEVEAELKHLLIYDKWIFALRNTLENVHNTSLQKIITSVSALCTRYARPLSEIESAVAAAESRVAEHLRQMGFEV